IRSQAGHLCPTSSFVGHEWPTYGSYSVHHRVRLGAPHTVQDIRAATNGRHLGTVDTLAQNVSLPNTPPSHYLEKSPPPVGQSPHLLQHPAFSLG
ncbi:MAG: hypothetical protein ACFNTM_00920, partial [Cardiobacterium sp.]